MKTLVFIWDGEKGRRDARLRYEVKREFAPYVAVSWTQSYGSTKRLARAEGEDTSLLSIVAGVRMWF